MSSKIHGFTVLTSGVALVLGLALPLPATADDDNRGRRCPSGKFPASGQTTAYQADINDGTSDNPVDVPDDGTLKVGATLRYSDNGDGTITDRNTKLTWEKKSADGGLHDQDNAYLWSAVGGDTIWDWLEDINTDGGTGFAGHHDWRIPNVKELQSIVNYGNAPGPVVSSAFNTNCTTGVTVLTGSCTAAFFYWSSTTSAVNPSNAWFVNFGDGFVDALGKNDFLHVRAVRGGCR